MLLKDLSSIQSACVDVTYLRSAAFYDSGAFMPDDAAESWALYCVMSAPENLLSGTTKDGSRHRLAMELAVNTYQYLWQVCWQGLLWLMCHQA